MDGAIHQAAGAAELHAACVPLAPCEPGEVRVTAGFRLAARWILHTVGPVYRDGKSGEADVLAACYRQCLETADRMALSSIAFPALSTGVYGYPKGEAARIAVRTLRASRVASVRRIVLVAYDRETYDLLTAALREAEEQS